MSIKRWIEVTFQEEGIHYYPGVENDMSLEPVAFLAYRHRHMFHFNVRIEVFHDDRELEFIMVKRELQSLMRSDIARMNGKSCEMLAVDIIEYITNKYPGRDIVCKVFEDGENGAVLEYTK